MLRRTLAVLAAITALMLAPAVLAKGKTSVTWYGHSAFKIVTPQGHVLLIDPWITNPANPKGKDDLAALDKVDLILVTHGHFDHIGDAVEIGKRTGAQLVTNYDLGSAMVDALGYPAKQAGFGTLGHFGGTLTLLDGEVQVKLVPAVHGGTFSPPAASGVAPSVVSGGPAGGFVIRIKDGPTFYHTGDTALFGDMKFIGMDKVDVMLTCIGDHFTMGPKDAAMAVMLVHPKVVIPMHYGTFPILTGTPEEFRKQLKAHHVKAKLDVMQVGQTLDF
ncbi:MAG TPA: metal-dependent hydrolase [Gammaproteobacteria bacterium]|nr:metal-dependent hydrolase [Gammaproteobacteria bacterium]